MKNMKRWGVCALVVCACAIFVACDDDDSWSPASPNPEMSASQGSSSSSSGKGSSSSAASSSSEKKSSSSVASSNSEKESSSSATSSSGERESSSSVASSNSESSSSEESSSSIKSFSRCNVETDVNCIVDERDGENYRIRTIGTQTWIIDNIRYKMEHSLCGEEKDDEECAQYGDYYYWSDAKKACPEGWRLPSKSEYEVLIDFYGDSVAAVDSLISKTGFDAMLRGYVDLNISQINDIGWYAMFWTASKEDYFYGSNLTIAPDSKKVFLGKILKDIKVPVRCIRNDGPPLPESSSSVPWRSSSSVNPDSIGNYFVDARDGQAYKVVTIGSQTWMAENLRYAAEDHSGCMKSYNAKFCESEGLFYAYTVALTACPDGWHLPSKEEYETLITTVGGASAAAAAHALKSTSDWYEGNGTDEYGFRIVPDGYRYLDDFGYDDRAHGEYAFLWTSSVDKNSRPYYAIVTYFRELDVFNLVASSSIEDALSVRCLKD